MSARRSNAARADAVVPEEDRTARRANFGRVLRGDEEPFTYHQGDVVTRALKVPPV